MIHLVQGIDAHRGDLLCRGMFELRAEIFDEKLNWDVQVEDGLEVDDYDNSNPLYLISKSRDETLTGPVNGSCRLLPTSGDNMMKGPFEAMLPDDLVIESARVWECSRLCVSPTADRKTSAELLIGICEVSVLSGIDQIVGVFETPMQVIYRRIGWEPEIINRQSLYGSDLALGLWDADEASLEMLRERWGISESVLVWHDLDARMDNRMSA